MLNWFGRGARVRPRADRGEKLRSGFAVWRPAGFGFLPLAAGVVLAATGAAAAQQNYIFRLNNIRLLGTVSPSSDTDTAVFTVKVGDQTLGPVMKPLGDLHAVNTFPIGLELGPVSVPDDTPVLISYQIVNSGHGADPGKIVQTVGSVVKAFGPVGNLIDPTVGQVVVAIGGLANDIGTALSSVWNFTDCDKVVINEALGTKGSVIRREAGAKAFSTVVKQYDVGGPPGFNVCHGHVTQIVSFSLLPNYVRIDNRNSSLSMDIRGGSTDNGAPVQQYITHNGPDQRWHLVPTNGVEKPDFAAIVSVNSGKAIDVPGGSHATNVPIQQYALHGGPNQRWRFVAMPGGQSVQILNDESGLALDVPNGSTAPGTIIQQLHAPQWDEPAMAHRRRPGGALAHVDGSPSSQSVRLSPLRATGRLLQGSEGLTLAIACSRMELSQCLSVT